MWRSDSVKGVADSLHRKLELEDSFGWSISNAELSDIIADAPFTEAALHSSQEHGAKFFASGLPVGSKRGLANLEESAWWTKHLSRTMWRICLAGLIAVTVVCILLLYYSVHYREDGR